MNRRLFLQAIIAILFTPMATVRAGDILLTRNIGGDANNPTPGYYNHSAIITIKNWVIEAQAKPNAVIAVPIWDFFDRYPEILVLRPNSIIGKETAQIAPNYVGRKYAKYMSVRPLYLWKNRDNCVSLIRRIYYAVLHKDYRWRVPDDILHSKLFTKVALKKQYANFKTPVAPFKHMVTRWTNTPATR